MKNKFRGINYPENFGATDAERLGTLAAFAFLTDWHGQNYVSALRGKYFVGRVNTSTVQELQVGPYPEPHYAKPEKVWTAKFTRRPGTRDETMEFDELPDDPVLMERILKDIILYFSHPTERDLFRPVYPEPDLLRPGTEPPQRIVSGDWLRWYEDNHYFGTQGFYVPQPMEKAFQMILEAEFAVADRGSKEFEVGNELELGDTEIKIYHVVKTRV